MSDLPATPKIWQQDDIQARFLGLIAEGYPESEALDLINEANRHAGSTDRVSLVQYQMFKRGNPSFQRALAAVMEARVASLEQTALKMAVESEDFREKIRYLDYNEKKISRLERQATRHEEQDINVALASGPDGVGFTPESDLVQAVARRRQLDRSKSPIIEVEVEDDSGTV